VPPLCREHGINSATFYKWRSKFGGMDASLISQLKELQDENRRLKMYADAQLSAELLKEAMAKNGEAISTQGDGPMGCGERSHEYPARLPDVSTERDRLSLPSLGARGECADR
jgi:putative transposase